MPVSLFLFPLFFSRIKMLFVRLTYRGELLHRPLFSICRFLSSCSFFTSGLRVTRKFLAHHSQSVFDEKKRKRKEQQQENSSQWQNKGSEKQMFFPSQLTHAEWNGQFYREKRKKKQQIRSHQLRVRKKCIRARIKWKEEEEGKKEKMFPTVICFLHLCVCVCVKVCVSSVKCVATSAKHKYFTLPLFSCPWKHLLVSYFLPLSMSIFQRRKKEETKQQ